MGSNRRRRRHHCRRTLTCCHHCPRRHRRIPVLLPLQLLPCAPLLMSHCCRCSESSSRRPSTAATPTSPVCRLAAPMHCPRRVCALPSHARAPPLLHPRAALATPERRPYGAYVPSSARCPCPAACAALTRLHAALAAPMRCPSCAVRAVLAASPSRAICHDHMPPCCACPSRARPPPYRVHALP